MLAGAASTMESRCRRRRPRNDAGRPPSPDSAPEDAAPKGHHPHDSDVDSGIVTCRVPGQRIGSTSSADTDSSHEGRYYRPAPVQGDPPCRASYTCGGSLRVAKRTTGLTLKQCSRRPPTPLSVFPESPCVRFDEQLPLSEHNIRRSCRKLFATLYAQRPHMMSPLAPASPAPPQECTCLRRRCGPSLVKSRSCSTLPPQQHTGRPRLTSFPPPRAPSCASLQESMVRARARVAAVVPEENVYDTIGSVPQRPRSVGVVAPHTKPSTAPAESEVEYAVVDKSKKNGRFSASLPALVDAQDAEPPVPPKLMHDRRRSLLSRVQTMTRQAKSVLQKAFSAERIYRPEREERREEGLSRSRSFIRGLSLRRKGRRRRAQSEEDGGAWEAGGGVRGQLLQLNLDGSQVVELVKPRDKPYGFFVARGRVGDSKGVFVSRMRDPDTQKELSGLLGIGDEILEIDGRPVKHADILHVNDLMAHKNTLLLTLVPYMGRKHL